MHEVGMMKSLMNKILTLAAEQEAVKVTKVTVALGALSHMSADHFKEHFDIAAKGTIAEGAEIEAELSNDIADPHALDVLLTSIDIA